MENLQGDAKGAQATQPKATQLVVGAVVVDDLRQPTRFLAAQRAYPAQLRGQWEFPGGKVEPGESCEQALERELMEELGVSVHLGSEVQGDHPQGWVLNEKAAMRVFLAEISMGEPLPLQDHRELRWVSVKKQSGQDILDLPWIPADLPIVRELLSILHQS